MKDIVIKMPLDELPDSFIICGDNGHIARRSHILIDGHDISGAVTGFSIERPHEDFAKVTLTLIGRVVFESVPKTETKTAGEQFDAFMQFVSDLP